MPRGDHRKHRLREEHSSDYLTDRECASWAETVGFAKGRRALQRTSWQTLAGQNPVDIGHLWSLRERPEIVSSSVLLRF